MKFIGSLHVLHKNKKKDTKLSNHTAYRRSTNFRLNNSFCIPSRSCFYTFSCESAAINSAAFNVLHSAAALLKARSQTDCDAV